MTDFDHARHSNPLVLSTLLLLILAQTFSVAIREKMHQRIPESSDHYAQAISIVISHANFKIDKYVGDRNVYETLIANGFGWKNHLDPAVLNGIIAKAREVSERSNENLLFSVGDIGFVDYTFLAFLIFGYKIESLLYFYFLLLVLQVVLFFMAFRKNNIAMAGLILFLLSHSITLNGLVGAGYNLWTVHNNRFLPVLGILPVMHICLLALFNKPAKLGVLLGAVVQVLLYIFIIRCRGSAFWMVGLLLLTGGIGVVIRFKMFPWIKALIHRSPTLANIQMRLWPVLTALGLVFLSMIIKPYMLDPQYYSEKNIASHTFWYPVYVGLAINHEIREIYGPRDPYKSVDVVGRFKEVCDDDHSDDSPLKAKARVFVCKNREIAKLPLVALRNWNEWILDHTQNDQDGARAVLKWLRENGKKEEHLYTFGPEDKVGYPRWFGQCDSKEKYLQDDPANASLRKYDSKKDFKWREMDRIMGQVVKDAVVQHPLVVLKTVFIVKPFFFLIYYVLYFLRITTLTGIIIIIASYVYLLSFLKQTPLGQLKMFLKIIFIAFMCSMIVPLMAYPALHTISDQVVLLTTCLLGLVLKQLLKKRALV